MGVSRNFSILETVNNLVESIGGSLKKYSLELSGQKDFKDVC